MGAASLIFERQGGPRLFICPIPPHLLDLPPHLKIGVGACNKRGGIYNGHIMNGEANIKDTNLNTRLAIKDTSYVIFSSRVNKLASAVYIVTDVLEDTEPLCHQLRTLAIEIISDIHLSAPTLKDKISAILSLLEVGRTVRIISEMNGTILEKEFLNLQESINDKLNNNISGAETDLSKFLASLSPTPGVGEIGNKGHKYSKIGVQKGGTLLQALKDVEMSDMSSHVSYGKNNLRDSLDLLRKERRNEIISVLKRIKDGATITDIKSQAIGILASAGEKTLQRELAFMVSSGVLKKTGEKRWSRYFINN